MGCQGHAPEVGCGVAEGIVGAHVGAGVGVSVGTTETEGQRQREKFQSQPSKLSNDIPNKRHVVKLSKN